MLQAEAQRAGADAIQSPSIERSRSFEAAQAKAEEAQARLQRAEREMRLVEESARKQFVPQNAALAAQREWLRRGLENMQSSSGSAVDE